MIIHIEKDSDQMGTAAAAEIARLLREAIKKRGEARLLLSTGASQFSTLTALVKEDVDFSKVTMFHLDEYADLPETHSASFRKYLNERFIGKVSLKKVFLVDGNGDIEKNIAALTEEIRKAPIDVGVIGIGENGHIAFNDPPADFKTEKAYLTVELDNRCKEQQVHEGWFAQPSEVPKKAVTMSVSQMMSCRNIISPVPHAVKADAIQKTLSQNVNNMVPATILKTHPSWQLFLDEKSASGFIG